MRSAPGATPWSVAEPARGDARHVRAVPALRVVRAGRGGAGAELRGVPVRAVRRAREAGLGDDAAAEERVRALDARVEDDDRRARAVEARGRRHVRPDAGDALGEARPERAVRLDPEHLGGVGQRGQLVRIELEGEQRQGLVAAHPVARRPADAAESAVRRAPDVPAPRPLHVGREASCGDRRREPHDHARAPLPLGLLARRVRHRRRRARGLRGADEQGQPELPSDAHDTRLRWASLRDDRPPARSAAIRAPAPSSRGSRRCAGRGRGGAAGSSGPTKRAGGRGSRRRPASGCVALYEGAVRTHLRIVVQLLERGARRRAARPRPRGARSISARVSLPGGLGRDLVARDQRRAGVEMCMRDATVAKRGSLATSARPERAAEALELGVGRRVSRCRSRRRGAAGGSRCRSRLLRDAVAEQDVVARARRATGTRSRRRASRARDALAAAARARADRAPRRSPARRVSAVSLSQQSWRIEPGSRGRSPAPPRRPSRSGSRCRRRACRRTAPSARSR